MDTEDVAVFCGILCEEFYRGRPVYAHCQGPGDDDSYFADGDFAGLYHWIYYGLLSPVKD